MATTLKSIVEFTNVAAGAQSTLAHGLNVNGTSVPPDEVKFDNRSFTYVAATATTITVRNDGPVAASLNALVEHWHTYERDFGSSLVTALTPQPFVNSGEGGNVADFLGTTGADVDVGSAAPPAAGYILTATDPTHATWQAGGVANPLLLATGDANVTGPAAYASAALGHSPVGGAVPNIRVGAAGSGIAAGWATGYLGSALDITAGGHGSMAVGYIGSPLATAAANIGIHASGHGSFAHGKLGAYGGYNSYIEATAFGAHAHGFSYANGAQSRIRATGIGATAMGHVYADPTDSDILASGYGALANGYCTGGGYIYATGDGAFAGGRAAENHSSVYSTGRASFAFGDVRGWNHYSYIHATSNGAVAMGRATGATGINRGNGAILSESPGSFALGSAQSAGNTGGIATIHAHGDGAFAMGCAEVSLNDIIASTIYAEGTGSIALGRSRGHTNESRIYSTDGGFAFGFSDGTQGYALVYSDRSFVGGLVDGGAIYGVDRSVAIGRVLGAGSIIRSDNGAAAIGYACAGGYVHANYGGSVVLGQAFGSGGQLYSAGGIAGGSASPGYIYAGWGATVAIGYAGAYGTISSTGYGGFALGYTSAYAAGGIYATGKGSFAMGYAYGDSLISTFNAGAIALGGTYSYGRIYGSNYGAVAMGYARDHGIISSSGGLAAGYANDGGYLLSQGSGSIALGKVDGGNMYSSGNGSLCLGFAYNGGLISSAGKGSFAMGYVNGAGAAAVAAVGDGAGAFGAALTANVFAAATNAFQFGQGNNYLADSLQVGNAGLRMKGTTGAPGAYLQNGDIWVANNYVYIYSNGVACKCVNAAM